MLCGIFELNNAAYDFNFLTTKFVLLYLIKSLKEDLQECLNYETVNPLSANPTKRSNTLKQFLSKLPPNCLSVFDHYMGVALKRLIRM